MIKTDRWSAPTIWPLTALRRSDATGSGAGGRASAGQTLPWKQRDRENEDRAYIESCFGRCLSTRREQLAQGRAANCAPGCIWAVICGSAPRVPSPAQGATMRAGSAAAWRSRPNCRPNATAPTSAKNQRAAPQRACCALPSRSATAFWCISSQTQRVRTTAVIMCDRGGCGALPVPERRTGCFYAAEEENCPAFTVDLLLDASASRLHCQEVIAAQGVILAESLANCGIPVRVSSLQQPAGLYGACGYLKRF